MKTKMQLGRTNRVWVKYVLKTNKSEIWRIEDSVQLCLLLRFCFVYLSKCLLSGVADMKLGWEVLRNNIFVCFCGKTGTGWTN